SSASPNDPNGKLANLVELFRRLEKLDEERAQVRAASAKPDEKVLKALDDEQSAILAWFRAALGEGAPGAVASAVKPSGPAPAATRPPSSPRRRPRWTSPSWSSTAPRPPSSASGSSRGRAPSPPSRSATPRPACAKPAPPSKPPAPKSNASRNSNPKPRRG